MESENKVPEVKTKHITFGLLVGWAFGIFIGLPAIMFLFTNTAVGIVLLLAALIAFPPSYNFLKKKTKLSLSRGLRVIVVVILCFIAGSILSSQSTHKTQQAINAITQSSETQTPQTTTTPTQAPIVVTAAKLDADYQSNEVSADAKYKGNLVEVSGTIYEIGKDIFNNPYVQIQAGEYDPLGVQCMFSQSNESALASLSKGQTVTVEGTVSGKTVYVAVDDCKVVK